MEQTKGLISGLIKVTLVKRYINKNDLLEYFEPKIHVIFVTAYDEFAIRAFEVNTLDCLLKPIHPDRLKDSLKKLGSP